MSLTALDSPYMKNDWRLATALTASQMGLWDWDLQSNVVTWSPETFKIVGLEDFDGSFDSFAKLLHPEDVAHVMDTVEKSLNQKTFYSDEFRILCPNGEERWLYNLGRPTFDKNGSPLRLSGTVQDITERKRYEEALLQRERALKEAQRLAHIGDWRWDANSKEIWWSDELYRIYEKAPGSAPISFEDALGNYTPESAGRLTAVVQKLWQTGEPYVIDLELNVSAGQRRWVQARGEAIFNSSGLIEGLRGTAQDITRLKEAEEFLKDARDILELQVNERTASLTLANAQLLAEIAERIQAENKLDALTQELAVTEERERGRIAGELHDQVGQNLIFGKMKLQELAHNLLDENQIALAEGLDKMLSKSIEDIRSLTFQLRPPILANAGLGSAIKWLAEEFRGSYGLQYEVADDLEQKKLRYEVSSIVFQAVREILLNVVKHSECKLTHIKLKRALGDMVIEIVDDGRGFNPAEVGTRKTRVGGFGLFNVKKRLEYLGGSLDIQTQIGKGTQVKILVPFSVAETSELEPPTKGCTGD